MLESRDNQFVNNYDRYEIMFMDMFVSNRNVHNFQMPQLAGRILLVCSMTIIYEFIATHYYPKFEIMP